MSHKCHICKKEIKTTFLNKINGTIIKKGKGETSKTYYICSQCQKEYKDELKKKLEQSDKIL